MANNDQLFSKNARLGHPTDFSLSLSLLMLKSNSKSEMIFRMKTKSCRFVSWVFELFVIFKFIWDFAFESYFKYEILTDFSILSMFNRRNQIFVKKSLISFLSLSMRIKLIIQLKSLEEEQISIDRRSSNQWMNDGICAEMELIQNGIDRIHFSSPSWSEFFHFFSKLDLVSSQCNQLKVILFDEFLFLIKDFALNASKNWWASS